MPKDSVILSLYDGLKNLLIVPILLYAGRQPLPQGVQTGIFLFLYAFLRIFVDVFREYPTTLLGLATGQVLNILLSILGLGLILIPFWNGSMSNEAPYRARWATRNGYLAAPVGAAWRLLCFCCSRWSCQVIGRRMCRPVTEIGMQVWSTPLFTRKLRLHLLLSCRRLNPRRRRAEPCRRFF